MSPSATQSSTALRSEVAISIAIHATPERIWALLTDADKLPSWNSTVSTLRGPIEPGVRLALTVPAAPGRTFKPRVTAFEANRKMVWSDGFAPMFRGVRTFTLTPRADGTTEFAMVEVFSGLMLPMIKKSLPDFGPSFETYASDLKRAAEAR